MTQASSSKSQLPSFRNAWTMFVGGLLAFGIFWGVSILLGKIDSSGLFGLLLTPFFLGAVGAILYGGISLLLIGIKKAVKS